LLGGPDHGDYPVFSKEREKDGIGVGSKSLRETTCFPALAFVKTILSRRGGNELVSGATTGAFRQVAEWFEGCTNRR
jgi:chorismate synthase